MHRGDEERGGGVRGEVNTSNLSLREGGNSGTECDHCVKVFIVVYELFKSSLLLKTTV